MRYRQRPRSRAAEAGPGKLPRCVPAVVELLAPCCGQGTSPPTCLSAGRDGAPALASSSAGGQSEKDR